MGGLPYVNLALDLFSLVLSFLPILYLICNHRFRQKINRYFLGVCLSNILMIFGDLAQWCWEGPAWPLSGVLLTCATVLYYLASTLVLYFFIRYILEYLGLAGRVKTFCLSFGTILCGIQGLLALTSPWTGALFSVTETGYHRGSLYFICQCIPLLCYLLFLSLLAAYRKKLLVRENLFLLLYICIPLAGGIVQMVLPGIAVVNACITLATLVILMNIQIVQEAAFREQEKVLSEQHIDLMLSQIQPHFLYNCLGTIYHLCESDPAAARKAVKRFADFLRGNMDSLKNREPIPFGQELNHVMNYLYLEQQRFGDKLQVIYQIKTEDFLIPPLALQPLVENAVQHGILHRKSGGTILIRTEETEQWAVITVEDNGVGMEKSKEYPALGEHSHIGIANVQSRLAEMVQGSLNIQSSDQGTTATIRIPWTGGLQL